MAATTTPIDEQEEYAYHNSNDPNIIKAQIRKTRAELSQTINAIQQELSPQHLVEQAKESLKEVTLGKVEEMTHHASVTAENWRGSFIHTVKENPMPVALMGIGLGWLIFNNKRSDDDYVYYPTTRDMGIQTEETRYFDRADALGYEPEEEDTPSIKDRVTSIKDKAAETVSEAASTLQEKTGQMAEGMRHRLSSTQDRTRARSNRLANQAKYNARYYGWRTKEKARDSYQGNPLTMGLVAIAAGALVGLLVPNTPQENEWLGETRDQLFEQAQAKVKDTAEKVQQVVKETQHATTEAAKQEAQKQELPGF
ncbi:MAG TPA: DUF3618 domain-containing protein [Anaerolineae bacterium]|nr:DUF3618 domain-containing protein [Anaerolineae bacterium]